MLCPIYKNKQVFSEFNEIVTALGGRAMTLEEFADVDLRNSRTGTDYAAMLATYTIWNENNGNSIDLAPNEEPSKLFLSLLSHFNGDRAAAIRAKSKTFSKSFKTWFGLSKVVDSNGEPLVVYHGTKTANGINANGFSSDFSGLGNRGAAEGNFYFTNSEENAKYTGLTERQIVPFINVVLSVYDMFGSTNVPSVKELYALVEARQQLIKTIAEDIRNLPSNSFIRKVIGAVLKFLNKQYKNPNLLKNLYLSLISDLNAEITNLLKQIPVSYNFTQGLKFVGGDKSTSSINPWNFIEQALTPKSEFRQDAGNIVLNALYGTKDLVYSPDVFPVFLSILNPLESDFNMSSGDENPLLSKAKFSDKAKLYNDAEGLLLTELRSDKYDGSISKNKFDILFSDVFIAKHASQIKHVGNKGSFSPMSNDIRRKGAIKTFTFNDFVIKTYDKPWKDGSGKSNKAKSFALPDKPNDVFELVKDLEEGYWSVHFKPEDKDNKNAWTKEEKERLFDKIASEIPVGDKLSTRGELSKGGISALNRFGYLDFTRVGARTVKDREGNSIDIPIWLKNAPLTLNTLDKSGTKLAAYFKGLSNSREVLQMMLDNGWLSEEHIPLAKKMLQYAVPFKLEKVLRLGPNVQGSYFRGGISVMPAAMRTSKQDIGETVLHEMAHFYLVQIINNPVGLRELLFVADITEVYEAYQNAENTEDHQELMKEYGMTDVDEFVSEIMSNRKFRNLLRDQNKSWFSKIIHAIARVLNLASKDGVDAVMDQIEEFIEFGNKNGVRIDEDDNTQYSKIASAPIFELTKGNLGKVSAELRKILELGIKSRMRAIQSRDIHNKSTLLKDLELLHKNLMNNTVSDIDNILHFVYDVRENMINPIKAIVMAASNETTTTLSNNALTLFSQDYFGFYDTMISQIGSNLTDSTRFKEALGEEVFDELREAVMQIRAQFDIAKSHLRNVYAQNAEVTLMKHGNGKSSTIANYIADLLYTTEHDMNMFTKAFYSGDKVQDEAVRVMFDMLLNAEDRVELATFRKGKALQKLLDKVEGAQILLQELDKNGKPTGNLIRDYNYGQLESERLIFMNNLRTKYGLSENQALPADKKLRTDFNKEKNAWMDAHGNRKYVAAYYDAFSSLSEETVAARDAVQFKIHTLTDKYRLDNGDIDLNDLTDKELAQLAGYQMEKKALSAKYYPNGVMKAGIELLTATELSELNKQLSESLEYETNWDKFERVEATFLKSLKDKGLSALEIRAAKDKWELRNMKYEYSAEFRNKMDEIEKREYGEDYQKLAEQRREILKAYRDDRTGATNTDLIPDGHKARVEVTKIDKALSKIRIAAGRKKTSGVKFSDIAEMAPTGWYHRDKKLAIEMEKSIPGSYSKWERLNHTYDQDGIARPNSYYMMMIPKDRSLVLMVPNNSFLELSNESPFRNPNFDNSKDEYFQPGEQYNNKTKYAEVMAKPGMQALYNALVLTMLESNGKLRNLTTNNPYRLPLISGSAYRFLKAGGIKNIHKSAAGYVVDQVSTRGDDVGYAETPTTRPDGTKLRMVPTYFIKQLEDPATITADVVGSVISYFKMAENFKLKSAIQPDLEVIKTQLGFRLVAGTNVNTQTGAFRIRKDPKTEGQSYVYKFAEGLLDMQLYGEMSKSLFLDRKKRTFNINKIVAKVRTYGTLVNLGCNVIVAATAFTTSTTAMLVQAVTGRYYDNNDAVRGWATMVGNLWSSMRNVGNLLTDNKMILTMERFGVATSNEKLFGDTNISRAQRVAKNEWAFGAYSIGDFIVKGAMMNSAMYNYKHYRGEFINKQSFMSKYFPNDKKQGLLIWKSLDSFYDSIEVVNHEIQPKAQYKDAFEAIEPEIRKTVRNITVHADGQLTSMLKTLFQATAIGSLCMMHRAYIPSMLQERFGMPKQYDYSTNRTREALYRTPFRLAGLYMKDWKHRAEISKSLDSSDITNLRQLGAEATLALLVYPMISALLSNMADEDKRDWLLQMCALIAVRTKFEVKAPYGINDIFNTMKSPSAIFGLLDNANAVLTYPIDLIMSNSKKDIKSGPYKKWSRTEKALFKLTPFKNIWEAQDPAIKRRYFETQIDK